MTSNTFLSDKYVGNCNFCGKYCFSVSYQCVNRAKCCKCNLWLLSCYDCSNLDKKNIKCKKDCTIELYCYSKFLKKNE